MTVRFRMHLQQKKRSISPKIILGAQYGMQNPNLMLATIDINLFFIEVKAI